MTNAHPSRAAAFRSRPILLAALALLACATAPAGAADIYISPAGSDATGDGSQGNPYATFQFAVNLAVSGADSVIAMNGTYTGVGNRDIDLLGKAITVTSQNGATAVTIDCQGSLAFRRRAFLCVTSETSATVISGLTITGGFAPLVGAESQGGAIYAGGATAGSPTVSDCVFTSNTAQSTTLGALAKGGAIYAEAPGAPQILNCAFTANRAQGGNGTDTPPATANGAGRGGAIFAGSTSMSVTGCVFTGNWAVSGAGSFQAPPPTYGGAIEAAGGGPVAVTACSFESNEAQGAFPGQALGGAIHFGSLASGSVLDCDFESNRATTISPIANAAVNGGAISIETAGVSSIAHCRFASNSAAGGTGGTNPSQGGAIHLSGAGSIPIRVCSFVGNSAAGGASAARGGGLYSASSSPAISECLFESNGVTSAGGAGIPANGGGLAFEGSGAATLTRCVIRLNTASGAGGGGRAGGIFLGGSQTPTLRETVIEGNSATPTGGGGLFYTSTGVGSVIGCLIAGNAMTPAGSGGGLQMNNGTLNLVNTTISGNSVPIGGSGGGIFTNIGALNILNCTIKGNTAATAINGAGIHDPNGNGSTNLRNTILDGNFGNDFSQASVFGGTGLVSGGNNSKSDNFVPLFPAAPTDFNNVGNHNLGALLDNGGPSRTHAILDNTTVPFVIDGGNSAPVTETTDQRAAGFPRIVDGLAPLGAVVDRGAYEFEDCVGPIGSDDGLKLIVRQLPEATVCSFCSDADADGCVIPGQSLSEAFIAPSNIWISRVKIWGEFADNIVAGKHFDLLFHDDNAGTPSAVLATVADAPYLAARVTTGVVNGEQTEFGFDVYELTFHLNPPVAISAGTRHLEIFETNSYGGQDTFMWSSGVHDPIGGVAGMHVSQSAVPGAAWIKSNFNLSLELTAAPDGGASGGGAANGVPDACEVPPPAPLNDASSMGAEMPAEIGAGFRIDVPVTIKNTGLAVWSAANGYALEAVDDPCGLVAGGATIPMDPGLAVQPGQECTFIATIEAPSSPGGTCSLTFQMTQGGAAFGEPIEAGAEIADFGPNSAAAWELFE